MSESERDFGTQNGDHSAKGHEAEPRKMTLSQIQRELKDILSERIMEANSDGNSQEVGRLEKIFADIDDGDLDSVEDMLKQEIASEKIMGGSAAQHEADLNYIKELTARHERERKEREGLSEKVVREHEQVVEETNADIPGTEPVSDAEMVDEKFRNPEQNYGMSDETWDILERMVPNAQEIVDHKFPDLELGHKSLDGHVYLWFFLREHPEKEFSIEVNAANEPRLLELIVKHYNELFEEKQGVHDQEIHTEELMRDAEMAADVINNDFDKAYDIELQPALTGFVKLIFKHKHLPIEWSIKYRKNYGLVQFVQDCHKEDQEQRKKYERFKRVQDKALKITSEKYPEMGVSGYYKAGQIEFFYKGQIMPVQVNELTEQQLESMIAGFKTFAEESSKREK